MTKLEREKELAKLTKMLEGKNFKSKKEVEVFFDKFKNEYTDKIQGDKEEGDIEKAQDLVMEAFDSSLSRGKKLIKKALILDPNNVDAYNYLASHTDDVKEAISLYEKAINNAEIIFDKKFFIENTGYFWGLVETRPYMRSLVNLAGFYYNNDELDKSIEIYQKMLKLNPSDNQGVRYLLSTSLLSKNNLEPFEHFLKTQEEEDCAVWNFNKALYLFKKSGITKKSKKAIEQAYKSNKYVIGLLLGISQMPDYMPDYIGRGDKNEAISYVYGNYKNWDNTKDAFEWIYGFNDYTTS